MSASRKILTGSLVIAALVLAAWIVFRETRVPQNQNQVFSRVIELEKWGRYDKAVQVFQAWLNDSRRDTSKDDFLYQQIAMVYIAKAYKKRATRDASVHEAELNLEKALALYDRQAPKDIDIELFEIGGAYEVLGDVSGHDKCRLYDKARQAFVRQLPLIKGDSFIAYGHTFDLKRARAEINKHLDGVNEKYSKADCQPK